MEEITYKKFYRKADKHLNGKIKAHHGKRENQKLKPYLVLQYLMVATDENHTVSHTILKGFSPIMVLMQKEDQSTATLRT